MPFERYVYYILMVVAFAVACVRSKNEKSFKIICWLLFFSILTETASDYFRAFDDKKKYIPYHFYIPFEYCLVTFYLSVLLQIRWVKRILIVSIPVFLITSALISIYWNDVEDLPSWQYNIEGTLIIIWCIINLFNLPPDPVGNIFKTFQFWFCVAFMIMFSGQFFLNGFFNPLQNRNPEVKQNLSLVYLVLNYLFYTLIIFGLLCSRPTTNYISR